jgi:hypothetical protein
MLAVYRKIRRIEKFHTTYLMILTKTILESSEVSENMYEG